MISLLLEILNYLIELFCLSNNNIGIVEKNLDNDFSDLKALFKQNLQDEINNEIENNDFLKNFNERWNN